MFTTLVVSKMGDFEKFQLKSPKAFFFFNFIFLAQSNTNGVSPALFLGSEFLPVGDANIEKYLLYSSKQHNHSKQ